MRYLLLGWDNTICVVYEKNFISLTNNNFKLILSTLLILVFIKTTKNSFSQ